MTASSDFTVTLLGAGVPAPVPDVFGLGTLIEAGGRRLQIDPGRGTTIRLNRLRVPMGTIDVLLFTHYLSDHTVGIPDLRLCENGVASRRDAINRALAAAARQSIAGRMIGERCST